MYVNSMVASVPNDKKDSYIKHAKAASAIMKEHGALRALDAWGENVPEGKNTSFPMAVQKKDEEIQRQPEEETVQKMEEEEEAVQAKQDEEAVQKKEDEEKIPAEPVDWGEVVTNALTQITGVLTLFVLLQQVF